MADVPFKQYIQTINSINLPRIFFGKALCFWLVLAANNCRLQRNIVVTQNINDNLKKMD
jgi:hypothetical protein